MGSKRLTKEQVLSKLRELHPGLEFPSAYEDFNTVDDYTTVLCPAHGGAKKSFSNLMYGKTGCASCGSLKSNQIHLKPIEHFLSQLQVIGVKVVEPRKKLYRKDSILVECPEHGQMGRNIKTSLRSGTLQCPKCARRRSGVKMRKDLPTVLKEAKERQGYDFELKGEYVGVKSTLIGNCEKHGEFEVLAYNATSNYAGCAKCSTQVSKGEEELFEFINSVCPDAISQHKEWGLNVDIFIPSKNIAIEYNGLYYHSSKFKNKYDHRDRRRLLESYGVRLIQIWEHEWKENIVRVCKYLGAQLTPQEKLYGRHCTVSEVDKSEGYSFIDQNHLQGAGLKGGTYLGLFSSGMLVGCACFRRVYGRDELYRMAYLEGFRVLGGLSKVLSRWIQFYGQGDLTSFVDLDKFSGASYFASGFKKDKESLSLWYSKRDKVFSRQKLQKKYLKGWEHYSKDLTEVEILEKHGVFANYNSGTLKVILPLVQRSN